MLARLALYVWLPVTARLLLSLLAIIMPIEAHAAELPVVTVAHSRQAALGQASRAACPLCLSGTGQAGPSPWGRHRGTGAAELALYPVNGPPGAVIALAQHPTQPEQLWAIAAAATPSGPITALYRSQDGGTTWKPEGNDLSWLRFTALAVSPTGTLFLGTSDGLYMRRATDKVWRGVALEDVPTGSEKLPWPVQGVTIQQILLAGPNAAHIYVIAAENPKYARYWMLRSRDGGQSFERFLIQELSSGPGSGLGHLLIDPDDENWLYVTTRGGILISSDGGATWMPGGLDPSLTEGMAVAAMPPNQPKTLLAVRAVRDDQGVHLALAQSQDRGRTWSESALDLPKNIRPLDLVAMPGGRLLLSTDLGVFIGLRDSKVWATTSGDPSAMGAYQILVDVARPDVLWAATPLGVYRQSGAKAEWVAQNQGLPPNGRVQALYTSPEAPDVWLAAMARNKLGEIEPPAVLRTTDGGRSWHIANRLSGGRVNDFVGDPQQTGRVIAATYQGVCWSQDGGQSWSRCGLTDQLVQRVRVGPTGTLYAGTYGDGLYLSKDGGETWSQVGFAGMNITGMLVRTDGLYVVVQGSTSGLYRTQNDGASWQMLNWPAEPGVDVIQLTGNDQTLIALVARQGLWLSHDAGLTWTPAPGLPRDATFDMVWVDPRTPTRVIAAPDDAGLWISEDGGLKWKAGGCTFGDNKVLAIAADYRTREDVVVATMMTGVWVSGRGGRVSPPPDMVDARIEIVWPHGWAPVEQATRANLSLRLFRPDSLEPTPCGWTPPVEIWEARDSEPGHKLARAQPRQVGNTQATLWDVNNLDVSYAQKAEAKLYYWVHIPGVITRTSMWAHAADPRTYYPRPAWPTAISTTMPIALDARVLVVWPHDAAGRFQPVEKADLANVRVALYRPGTLTSIPPAPDLTVRLVGSLDNGVRRTIGIGQMRIIKDGFSYPVWDFDNVDVSAARDPRSRWTFWVEVDGYMTYSNVWIHGVDARTYFPAVDQPIVGCRP